MASANTQWRQALADPKHPLPGEIQRILSACFCCDAVDLYFQAWHVKWKPPTKSLYTRRRRRKTAGPACVGSDRDGRIGRVATSIHIVTYHGVLDSNFAARSSEINDFIQGAF